MLLTGDSEETERQWWLRNDPTLARNCTIIKLAHHGSRNGTDARWLELVKPELAVGSMGRNNEFGHPHAETVSVLRRSGIPFLRSIPARDDHDHERWARLAGRSAVNGPIGPAYPVRRRSCGCGDRGRFDPANDANPHAVIQVRAASKTGGVRRVSFGERPCVPPTGPRTTTLLRSTCGENCHHLAPPAFCVCFTNASGR